MGYGNGTAVAQRVQDVPEGVTASQHIALNNILGEIVRGLGASVDVVMAIGAAATDFAISRDADSLVGVIPFSAANLDIDAGSLTTFAIDGTDASQINLGAAHGAIFNAVVIYQPVTAP